MPWTRNRAALLNAATVPLENALNIDETGSTGKVARVWTGTLETGKADQDPCLDWTTMDANGMGGDPTSTGRPWTADRTSACATAAALYCFQISTQ